MDCGRKGPQMKDLDWFKVEHLPRFHIFEELLNDSVNAAMLDILLLVLYKVIFMMASYALLLRYDVT